jgi:hypothetical protein
MSKHGQTKAKPRRETAKVERRPEASKEAEPAPAIDLKAAHERAS